MRPTLRAVSRRDVTLLAVAREWTRIGCIGFGGPPAHIALLRDLTVTRREWLAPEEFEDAIATTNLLPGPGSTQLAIYTAWRVRGVAGALIGGLGFIVPGLVVILALAAVFLAHAPPTWIRGAGAGPGPPSRRWRCRQAGTCCRPAGGGTRGTTARAGRPTSSSDVAAAATLGPWLVALLLACGVVELGWRRRRSGLAAHAWPLLLASTASTGGLGALVWVAFKVGALSYGGGFVIIPLMQADAVNHYHWMTNGQFLNAVALGQVTPGPVVHTVAVVGYAASGVGGGLLAAAVAFAPSFSFILLGADRFDRIRQNASVRAFLGGAGPAAIGAIIGSAIPLARALSEPWQYAVLAGAARCALRAPPRSRGHAPRRRGDGCRARARRRRATRVATPTARRR